MRPCNFLVILLIFSVCIIWSPASAHPPQDMELGYDSDTGELRVTIQHTVADASDHFISNVVVLVQGKEIGQYPYTEQPDSRSFTYIYQVQADQGEEITVRALCNKAGSIEKSIRITDGTDVTTTSPPVSSTSTPGFESVITIIAILCICCSVRRSG